VVTQDDNLSTGNFEKISIQSADDMPKANKIGVVGGGELNGSLAELGVIDEVILDVEPVTLGQGKLLFGSHKPNLKLKLLSSKQIGESTLQNHYEVSK
jgi:dihydrofolate reductase